MSIEKRVANSPEFMRKKNLLKKIFSVRCFDKNMYKTNWKFVRKAGNLAYQLKAKDSDVEYVVDKIKDIKCLITKPDRKLNNDVIYYIHGGGFVSGGAIGSKSYCSMLASRAGCDVIAPEYGLAPENPFPCGFNDCYAVYEEIVKKYDKITVVGDSAGGNLTLGVTLKAKENGIKIPKCVIVHSPVVDLSIAFDKCSDDKDFIVKRSSFEPLKAMYCGDHDLARYELSPYLGDFTNFPPLFITCAEEETLKYDSEMLYKKAIDNNIKAKLIIMENAFHDYATIGKQSPETKKILDETIDFINEC